MNFRIYCRSLICSQCFLGPLHCDLSLSLLCGWHCLLFLSLVKTSSKFVDQNYLLLLLYILGSFVFIKCEISLTGVFVSSAYLLIKQTETAPAYNKT